VIWLMPAAGEALSVVHGDEWWSLIFADAATWVRV